MGLCGTSGHQTGLSPYTQNVLDAHSEYWGALSPCEPQSATLLHKLQAWNFTLFKCINALFKIEVSSDNGSCFYGLIHLHIWSQHEISSQLFKIAKSYPSSAPLICAVLHDINIYTITVAILQWPKLSHFKGPIFKEHNTLMEMQL